MNKYSKALAATVGFGLLLLVAYYARMRWFKVDVVFYAAIGSAVAAVAIAGLVVLASRWFADFSGLEKSQLILIWLLVGYAFAISVPTVIDRSLSFYLLEKLEQRGGAIRQDGFADVFTKEYMVEHRLVDVRLTEQLQSGTIEIRDGCVRLTERGQRLAAFSRWYRAKLLPQQRLLMGKYTDDLTDPFRNSPPAGDYACTASAAPAPR